MRDLHRRDFMVGAMGGIASLAANLLFADDDDDAGDKKWLIGHHFWNWDRAWIMVERDSRGPDHVRSARNMRAVLKHLGH